jgi:hypothetical protein
MIIVINMKSNKDKRHPYFQTINLKNGEECGLRLVNYRDISKISKIYREMYNFNFIKPFVYDIDAFATELSVLNHYWFLFENVFTEEIEGVLMIELDNLTANIRNFVMTHHFYEDYLDTEFLKSLINGLESIYQFKSVLKLNFISQPSEIKLIECLNNLNALNYGFIPAFFNFGDKRDYNVDDQIPYQPVFEEPALFYTLLNDDLWQRRENEIFLYDTEFILTIYRYVKNSVDTIKGDQVHFSHEIAKKTNFIYSLKKDIYSGIIEITGYFSKITLSYFLQLYESWRLIVWKIPTTLDGLNSVKLAIENDFIALGYDIGAFFWKERFHDMFIFAYYPNGINIDQFTRFPLDRISNSLVRLTLERILGKQPLQTYNSQ